MNRGTQTAGCTSHPATVAAAAAAAAAVEQETQSKENWISSFFFLVDSETSFLLSFIIV